MSRDRTRLSRARRSLDRASPRAWSCRRLADRASGSDGCAEATRASSTRRSTASRSASSVTWASGSPTPLRIADAASTPISPAATAAATGSSQDRRSSGEAGVSSIAPTSISARTCRAVPPVIRCSSSSADRALANGEPGRTVFTRRTPGDLSRQRGRLGIEPATFPGDLRLALQQTRVRPRRQCVENSRNHRNSEKGWDRSSRHIRNVYSSGR